MIEIRCATCNKLLGWKWHPIPVDTPEPKSEEYVRSEKPPYKYFCDNKECHPR